MNIDNLTRKGERVYINRSKEQMYPHLHMHEFMEIAYVAAGTGIHIINEEKFQVSKGDLFLINNNIKHEFRSIEDFPELIIYNCIFMPDFIDLSLDINTNLFDIVEMLIAKSLFPNIFKPLPDIKLLKKDTSIIESLYKKMYTEYQLAQPGYTEVLRANVLELLIQIFRIYSSQMKETDPKSNVSSIVNTIISYIQSNYNKTINFEEIANKSFISQNYLCVLFKKATGATMTEYMQNIRIEKACKMLLESNEKIITISNNVGYSDVKFFNKLFKKITSKTPTEYRKDKSSI